VAGKVRLWERSGLPPTTREFQTADSGVGLPMYNGDEHQPIDSLGVCREIYVLRLQFILLV